MQQQQKNFTPFRIKDLDRFTNKLNNDQHLPQDLKVKIQKLFDQRAMQIQEIDEAINPNHESVTLTREQIFTLILFMYLGLIETDLYNGGGFYLYTMKYIKESNSYKSKQKLLCILNYFHQYLNNQAVFQEQVTFTRACIPKNCDEITQKFKDSTFQSNLIEFQSAKMETYDKAVVIDFADKNVGGLALDPSNLAQEEIMMLIYPEALMCMLFIPPLKYNEAVLIENLIKFNDYEGYEGSFKQKKQEKLQINSLLAIDAKPFSNLYDQITKQNKNRELLKCFVGFDIAMRKQKNITISTGKWGCGIFGGDIYLKSLIQIIAFLMAAELNDSKNSKLIISTMTDDDLLKFGNEIKQCPLELGKYLNILDQITNVQQREFHLRDQIMKTLYSQLS